MRRHRRAHKSIDPQTNQTNAHCSARRRSAATVPATTHRIATPESADHTRPSSPRRRIAGARVLVLASRSIAQAPPTPRMYVGIVLAAARDVNALLQSETARRARVQNHSTASSLSVERKHRVTRCHHDAQSTQWIVSCRAREYASAIATSNTVCATVGVAEIDDTAHLQATSAPADTNTLNSFKSACEQPTDRNAAERFGSA
jgi:hypothetical protein